MPFKVLSLSDVLVEFIYSPRISARFSEVILLLAVVICLITTWNT